MKSPQRHSVFAAALCLAVLATTTVGAAENVFRMIPEEALGFAVINRLDEADAKLQALGLATQTKLPGLVGMLQTQVATQQGLDENRACALALLPGSADDDLPVGLLLVPVTDFGAFVGQSNTDGADSRILVIRFGRDEVLVSHDRGYALITKTSNREVLERTLDSPKRVPTGVADWEKWLGESDAAVVVMRPGFQALCNAVQSGLQLGSIPLELQRLEAKLRESPAERMRGIEIADATLQICKKINTWLASEVDSYAVAVTLDEQGNLHATERERYLPNGQLLDLLHEIQAPDHDLLVGLPSKPIVGVQSVITTERISQAVMDVSFEMMKMVPCFHGLSDDQIREMAQIAPSPIRRIRGVSKMLCDGVPGDPLLANVLLVLTVDDANAYFAEYKKAIEAAKELAKQAEGSILATVDFTDAQFSGCPGLIVSIQPPIRFAVGHGSSRDAFVESIVGPEKRINVYLARANENTVVVSYLSERLLLESLKVMRGTESGLAADANLARTSAMLPAGAQWCGYFSPQGIVNTLNQVVPTIDGDESCRLPEFPPTPPIGFVAKVVPEGFYSHTVIPAATTRAIGEYVKGLNLH